MKPKVSEWLGEIHSHEIVESGWAERKVKKLTGQVIDLSYSTAGEMRNHLGEFKGPETLNKKLPYKTRLIGGYTIAERVANKLLGRDPALMLNGRGSIHRACVEALAKAGY